MATVMPTREPIDPLPRGPQPGEARTLIRGIDWACYEMLLADFGDNGPRMSYSNGMLELMSPGPIHEQLGHILGRVVTILVMELDIPCKGQGSTTIKDYQLEKGLEADECFYLASLHLLRGQDLKGLDPFPPPDLAVEVEETAPLLNKLAIYAALGVTEVWRHNRRGLIVLVLGPDGRYAESPVSRVFPFLPLDLFREQLAGYDPDEETRWFRSFRDWVRDVVAPLYHR